MTARRVYFFSGPLYSRFDHPLDAVPGRYPLPILVAWPGMFLTVDAAVNWGNGKVYFFKDSEYVRYDVLLDAVDPGYPKGIAGVWTDAASATFDTGIDAAVNWGNGKVYLFKGGEYIRHDIASDTLDPGYPKPIKGNWPGVHIAEIQPPIDSHVDESIELNVAVALAGLSPDDVTVSFVVGEVNNDGDIAAGDFQPMSITGAQPDEDGRYHYRATVVCDHPGTMGFAVRVVPHHPSVDRWADLGLITSAS